MRFNLNNLKYVFSMNRFRVILKDFIFLITFKREKFLVNFTLMQYLMYSSLLQLNILKMVIPALRNSKWCTVPIARRGKCFTIHAGNSTNGIIVL